MNQMHHRRQNLEWSSRLVHWSQITTDTNRPDLVYINSFVADEGAGEIQTNEIAKHIQLYGFRSKPPVGCEVISLVCSGGSSQKVVVASDHSGLGPSDLQSGEAAIYTKSGSTILLDKDGNVTIIPKSGAKVRLGSGTPAELDAVALYTQLKSDFDAFVAKYNGHTHAVSVTGVMAGMATATGTAASTANTTSFLSTSVSSSNVQAKK